MLVGSQSGERERVAIWVLRGKPSSLRLNLFFIENIRTIAQSFRWTSLGYFYDNYQ